MWSCTVMVCVQGKWPCVDAKPLIQRLTMNSNHSFLHGRQHLDGVLGADDISVCIFRTRCQNVLRHQTTCVCLAAHFGYSSRSHSHTIYKKRKKKMVVAFSADDFIICNFFPSRLLVSCCFFRGKSLLESWGTTFLPKWQPPLIFVWFTSKSHEH